MGRHVRGMGLAAAMMVLGSNLANAAPPESEDFDALIHRGVLLRKEGDDRQAEELFRRAYALAQTPRAAAQLGLVEFALSKFEEAEHHLSESLEAREPWIEAHRKALEDSRTDVRTHLGRVDIVGAPPDARVVFGSGRSIALPANGTLWVAGGPISLRIESSGRNPVSRSADMMPQRSSDMIAQSAVDQ
jgi:tetratricopeptide (TPR) repeat protein